MNGWWLRNDGGTAFESSLQITARKGIRTKQKSTPWPHRKAEKTQGSNKKDAETDYYLIQKTACATGPVLRHMTLLHRTMLLDTRHPPTLAPRCTRLGLRPCYVTAFRRAHPHILESRFRHS
jgi:hypothetical protein